MLILKYCEIYDFLFVVEWLAIGKHNLAAYVKIEWQTNTPQGPHYAKVLEKFNATRQKCKWFEKFVITPYQFETFIARNKDHALIFSSSAVQPKI